MISIFCASVHILRNKGYLVNGLEEDDIEYLLLVNLYGNRILRVCSGNLIAPQIPHKLHIFDIFISLNYISLYVIDHNNI